MRAAGNWVEDSTDTICTALSFLRLAMDNLDPTDPEGVQAVAGALNTLVEAKTMAQVVDARLGAGTRIDSRR